MISVEWLRIIQEWAEPLDQISEVYLFGSWAKNSNHADSDLDLGVVLSERGEAAEEVWYDFHQTWEDYLERSIGCDVQLELANEEISPDIVAPAIRDHGILIFQRENP